MIYEGSLINMTIKKVSSIAKFEDLGRIQLP